MKKCLNIVLAGIGASLLLSCSQNYLNVVPNGVISEATFWKTEADADLALTGCYRGWEGFTDIVYGDGASDNGYAQYSYGFREMGNSTISASTNTSSWIDGNSGTWFSYTRVRKYNDFLSRIENISMDAAKKERYKAEVRFLRAYDYFNKIIHYGDVPLVTEVIIDPLKATLPRTPEAEVRKFVLDELNAIIAGNALPVQNVIDSRGHVTMGAVYALKARLSLYAGDFEAAQAAAKAVIDMGVYELYGDYRKLFTIDSQSDNKEAILSVQYVENNYQHQSSRTLLPNSQGGWAGMQATWDLVKAYESKTGAPFDENDPFKDKDPRLAMTFLYPGAAYATFGFPDVSYLAKDEKTRKTNKYFDPYGDAEGLGPDRAGAPINLPSLMPVQKYAWYTAVPDNQGGSFMVFRLAEMYLIFAEASLKTGRDQGLALGYINAIRARTGVEMPPVAVLTEDVVRRERRVELAFEGLRYFDIKRWDIGATALNGPVLGARQEALGAVNQATGKVTWSGPNVSVENRTFRPERKYLWPIPQSEINLNSNVTQNPGYN